MGAPPAGSPRWCERPRPSERGGRHYHRTVAGRGTPATVLLTELGVAYRVHAYDHDPRQGGYGVEASDALGIAPERVFKTLVAEVDGAMTVGVVPVSGHLDLKALAAAACGKKAVMADMAKAERATGYVAGGISPLGQRRPLPVLMHSSARGLRTNSRSAGRRARAIEPHPADLVRA